MTTRRQSSHVNGPAPTSTPPTPILEDSPSGPGTLTSEPSTSEANSLEKRPRSHFTLNRILLGVIPFSFVVSKFIDSSLNGATFTLNLLDLIPTTLMFILYWCSLYESDPPSHLQWLLDTDWDYVIDVSKQLAVTIISNPLETWNVFYLACSVLLSGGIIYRAWTCRRDCTSGVLLSLFFGYFALALMVYNVVFTIYGVSKHHAHTYRKSGIIVTGLLCQIGTLAILMLNFLFTINDERTFFEPVITCVFGVHCVLALLVEGAVNVSRSIFQCASFVCYLVFTISFIPPLLLMNYGGDWSVRILLTFYAVLALCFTGFYILDWLLDW